MRNTRNKKNGSGRNLSLSMILRIFLIFGDFEPSDSYKEDSYKKETVYFR